MHACVYVYIYGPTYGFRSKLLVVIHIKRNRLHSSHIGFFLQLYAMQGKKKEVNHVEVEKERERERKRDEQVRQRSTILGARSSSNAHGPVAVMIKDQ